MATEPLLCRIRCGRLKRLETFNKSRAPTVTRIKQRVDQHRRALPKPRSRQTQVDLPSTEKPSHTFPYNFEPISLYGDAVTQTFR